MNKKVLIVYYSQTGQLKDIVEQFALPLQESGVEVEIKRFEMEEEFSFPWSGKRFFNAMPESVLELPAQVKPLTFNHSAYDLIVFAYQPWFLSPSIPTTSILNYAPFIKLLANTPVITLSGSRNMWLMAQEKVKLRLKGANAQLVGNIALVDNHNNLASAVSILHWMLNGKKDKLWGVFPVPGIAAEDIKHVSFYGALVKPYLNENNYLSLQEELVKNGAVEIKTNLMFIEPRGKKLFTIWAGIIIKKKNRALWLKIFKYYLVIALFLVSPVVVSIYKLLFQPLTIKSIKRNKKYYSGVNLRND